MDGLSIIIPFLNENEGIEIFCRTIDAHATKLEFPIELVFVDDGSTDGTGDILRKYDFLSVSNVQFITLSKNYGSHAAIRAGLIGASYDICTWMGSDLQEPLEFIELAYKNITGGLDAVYIEKKSIGVSIANRGFSKMYSALMKKYAVSNYSSGGISTIVFNGKIKDFLNNNIEANSSIMLQIMNVGFNYIVIPLEFSARETGISKWTLSKKIKLFIDSFVAFSFMPIRLVSIIGILMFFIGIAFGIYIIVAKIFSFSAPAGYSTLACLISIGFGVTNISLGIIAEYLWRTYDAARGRPVFIISGKETLFEKKKAYI